VVENITARPASRIDVNFYISATADPGKVQLFLSVLRKQVCPPLPIAPLVRRELARGGLTGEGSLGDVSSALYCLPKKPITSRGGGGGAAVAQTSSLSGFASFYHCHLAGITQQGFFVKMAITSYHAPSNERYQKLKNWGYQWVWMDPYFNLITELHILVTHLLKTFGLHLGGELRVNPSRPLHIHTSQVGVESVKAAEEAEVSPLLLTLRVLAYNRRVLCPTQRARAIGLWVARNTAWSPTILEEGSSKFGISEMGSFHTSHPHLAKAASARTCETRVLLTTLPRDSLCRCPRCAWTRWWTPASRDRWNSTARASTSCRIAPSPPTSFRCFVPRAFPGAGRWWWDAI
jgi:hypothetical protein